MGFYKLKDDHRHSKEGITLLFPPWFGYTALKKNQISFTHFCSLISFGMQGNYRGEFMNPRA